MVDNRFHPLDLIFKLPQVGSIEFDGGGKVWERKPAFIVDEVNHDSRQMIPEWTVHLATAIRNDGVG
ncbi:MAG: hypothetical protein GY807_08160, partial [Gammaproteobacteria bacterium]|nr:hypothetical protein [Gammaproteobacteria bacterium]